MSAIGGKPDSLAHLSECRLIAKTGNLELIDEGQIKGDRWAGGLTLGSASRQPRLLFDQHHLGRGNVIVLGSLPFYCPRDAGSRLS